MNRSFTNTQEDEVEILPGTTAPSSMTAASPGSVIPFPFNRYAAAYPVDDASSLDEDVFELGELAVKIVRIHHGGVRLRLGTPEPLPLWF